MPPPTTDRDLLSFEPTLFRDFGWSGQRLLKGLATIAGTTLTLSAHDNDLAAAMIGPGHVIAVDGTPLEIVEVLSPTTAAVSRPRPSPDAPIQPPAPATNQPAAVATFAPQIAAAHNTLLSMLGLHGSNGAIDLPTEASIANPEALIPAEALMALHLIFSAASTLAGPGSPSAVRAAHYARRAAAQRALTLVHLDLDNDGRPDAVRSLNTIHFART